MLVDFHAISAAPARDSSALFARLMKGDTLDNFGRFMAPAGDVNRDGFDDFWVMRTFDYIWTDFYLYYGGTQLDTVPHVGWHLPAFRLYDVGDFNNDQYDDFLIVYLDTVTTAPLYFGLHYGGPLLSPQPAKRFPIHPYQGSGSQIGFDHMVTGGVDMDGDAKPDLLIGEPVGDGGNGAYLYSSKPTFDTIADYHFQYAAFATVTSNTMAAMILPNFDGHPYIALGFSGYGGSPGTPGHVALYRAGIDEPGFWPGVVYIYGGYGHNPTDVPEDSETCPHDYSILNVFPNSFNPGVKIEYALPVRSHVELVIFNLQGQHVATLIDRVQPAGTYIAEWDSRTGDALLVASGVYSCRLGWGSNSQTKKVILVR